MEFAELKKSAMAFQLKDGNILWIDKEDIKEIASKIIVEGSCTKQVVMLKGVDRSKEKADMLYNILRTQKDMDQKVITKYLLQISELLSNKNEEYEDIITKEQYIASDVELTAKK